MSLLNHLNANGVTAEDLEKAASVRLFEKAAHSEGMNLTELRTEVDAPINLNNPNMEIYPMDYIDLFEKQAADEGIDLDMLDDYELAELYNHFVDDVVEDDGFYDDDFDYDDDDYEKLAEAELLGEVMADAYLDKIAAASNYSAQSSTMRKYTGPKGEEGFFSRVGRRSGNRMARLGKAMSSKRKIDSIAAELKTRHTTGGKLDTSAYNKALRKVLRNRGIAMTAGAGLGAAGLGAGAYALAKKRSEKQAADPQGFFSRKNFKDGVGKARYQQGLAGGTLREGVGRFLSSEKGTGKMQKKMIKRLFGEGKSLANLSAEQKALLDSKMVKAFKRRGAGAMGLGATAALGGAAYAGHRMSKKAELIEELALEKAASWVDGDWEFDEIDDMSDELAAEILWEAGYDI